jgi:hypothetical protein
MKTTFRALLIHCSRGWIFYTTHICFFAIGTSQPSAKSCLVTDRPSLKYRTSRHPRPDASEHTLGFLGLERLAKTIGSTTRRFCVEPAVCSLFPIHNMPSHRCKDVLLRLISKSSVHPAASYPCVPGRFTRHYWTLSWNLRLTVPSFQNVYCVVVTSKLPSGHALRRVLVEHHIWIYVLCLYSPDSPF